MATLQDLDNAIASLNSESQTLAALALTMQATIATAVAALSVPPPAPIDYINEVGAVNAVVVQMNQAIITLQNSEATLSGALPH